MEPVIYFLAVFFLILVAKFVYEDMFFAAWGVIFFGVILCAQLPAKQTLKCAPVAKVRT
jgi:hypothetical protein